MTLNRKMRIPRAGFPTTKGTRAFFAFGSASFFPEIPRSAAVVVSKKAFKTSVLRHKAKRRVGNALKSVLKGDAKKGGIIIYPNQSVLEGTFAELQAALEDVFVKLSGKK